MATKTKPAPVAKPAPAAKGKASTAVIPWAEEMAGAAAKAAKSEQAVDGFAKRLSIKSGVLSIDGEAVEDNEIDVVVVGCVYENAKYDGPYNPAVPQVPSCYAFGNPDDEEPADGMKPHEKAEDPQGSDNGLCQGCWANDFGTADTGRGKACKNTRRLAVVTEDALESVEAMGEAEVRGLNVPVMSVRNWSKFVNKMAEDFSRPFWGVVCTVKVVPDPKSQFQVTFKFKQLIELDAELYEALKSKVAESNKILAQPYPSSESLAAKAAPLKPQGRAAQAMAKGAAAKKPASRKF